MWKRKCEEGRCALINPTSNWAPLFQPWRCRQHANLQQCTLSRPEDDNLNVVLAAVQVYQKSFACHAINPLKYRCRILLYKMPADISLRQTVHSIHLTSWLQNLGFPPTAEITTGPSPALSLRSLFFPILPSTSYSKVLVLADILGWGKRIHWPPTSS